MSRSTCIPLYPATDGQQTGNNFVDGNKQHVAGNKKHVAGNMCRATCCPGVNAALECTHRVRVRLFTIRIENLYSPYNYNTIYNRKIDVKKLK